MVKTIYLNGDNLSTEHINSIAKGKSKVAISSEAKKRLGRTRKEFERSLKTSNEGKADAGSYSLTDANTVNEVQLVKRTLYSHAVSCGKAIDPMSVRAAVACKVNSIIARELPVRVKTLNALLRVVNHGVTPLVRENDSINGGNYSSAMAEIILVVIGDGEALYRGEPMPGALALKKAGIEPVEPAPDELSFLISGTSLSIGELALFTHESEMIIKNFLVSLAIGIEPFIEIRKHSEKGRLTAEKGKGECISIGFIRRLLQKKNGDSATEVPFGSSIIPIVETMETAIRNVRNTRSNVESMINEWTWKETGIPSKDTPTIPGYSNKPVPSLTNIVATVLHDTVESSVAHSMRLLYRIKERGMKHLLSGYYNEQFLDQLSSTLSSLLVKAASLASCGGPLTSGNISGFNPTGRESAGRVAELISINNSAIAIENLLGYLNLSCLKKKNLGRGTSRAYRKIKDVIDSFDYKRPISQEMVKLELIVRDHSLVESVEKVVGPMEFV